VHVSACWCVCGCCWCGAPGARGARCAARKLAALLRVHATQQCQVLVVKHTHMPHLAPQRPHPRHHAAVDTPHTPTHAAHPDTRPAPSTHTRTRTRTRAMPRPTRAQVSLLHRREVMPGRARVLLGLHELLTYGLKGVAAYAHHAEVGGRVDPALDNVFEEVRRARARARARVRGVAGTQGCLPRSRRDAAAPRNARPVHAAPRFFLDCRRCGRAPPPPPAARAAMLAFLASEAAADADAVLAMCLRLGEVNFSVMQMLDEMHTGRCEGVGVYVCGSLGSGVWGLLLLLFGGMALPWIGGTPPHRRMATPTARAITSDPLTCSLRTQTLDLPLKPTTRTRAHAGLATRCQRRCGSRPSRARRSSSAVSTLCGCLIVCLFVWGVVWVVLLCGVASAPARAPLCCPSHASTGPTQHFT
jgi:hypothetical protein